MQSTYLYESYAIFHIPLIVDCSFFQLKQVNSPASYVIRRMLGDKAPRALLEKRAGKHIVSNVKCCQIWRWERESEQVNKEKMSPPFVKNGGGRSVENNGRWEEKRGKSRSQSRDIYRADVELGRYLSLIWG